MLPLLVCLLTAAGPFLGVLSPRSGEFLLEAVAGGFSLWLAGRVLIGYIPLPSGRNLAWVGGLLVLGTLSARLSPLWSQAVPAWRPTFAGLWIILAMAGVSKGERSFIDEVLRVSGWLLMLIVFYQRLSEGAPRPPGVFPSPAGLSAACLLLLPLAVQREDRLLTGGLVLALCWSGGAGAWLGLAAALMIVRACGIAGFWGGLGAALVCLVVIYGKFQSPEVLDRWRWWTAAWRMAWASPGLGWGPGAFASASSVFLPGGGFAPADAHHLPLQLAAELGWPFAAAWLAGIIHCLRVGGPHKSFGAIAVLVQSLWEPALSAPSNLWLFSYFAGSSISESSHGFNVASRYKPAACVLALGMGWALVRAVEPGVSMTAAPVAAPTSREGRLLSEAARLEAAAEKNPYDARVWAELQRLYTAMGLGDLSAAKAAEGANFRGSR